VGATFDVLAMRIDASAEAQRALLQAASHELRTPLSRLRLGLQLLALQDDAEGREVLRHELDGDFAELDRLVDELLALARAQAAQTVSPVAIDVRQRLETSWRPPERRALTLPAEGVVWADPDAFDRAVRNALNHAVIHGAYRIVVRCASEEASTLLTVDDDAPGVPEDPWELLLQPFQRGATKAEGHGLGLAILQRTLHQHGGEAWLATAPEGGLRGAMRWPRA
jgi:two-component system sensor histidine kinase RstB